MPGAGLNVSSAQLPWGQFSFGKSGVVIPISFSIASPENWNSVGTCAFQPKRPTVFVPVRMLSVMLTRPATPSARVQCGEGDEFGVRRGVDQAESENRSGAAAYDDGRFRRHLLRHEYVRSIAADCVILQERAAERRERIEDAASAACESRHQPRASASRGRSIVAVRARSLVEHRPEAVTVVPIANELTAARVEGLALRRSETRQRSARRLRNRLRNARVSVD